MYCVSYNQVYIPWPLRPYLVQPLTTSQDLSSPHSPPYPLCSMHTSLLSVPKTHQTHSTQGLHTCCSFCLESFSHRFSESWLLPDIQISAQMSLLRKGLPSLPISINIQREFNTQLKMHLLLGCTWNIYKKTYNRACISFNTFPIINMLQIRFSNCISMKLEINIKNINFKNIQKPNKVLLNDS